MKLSERINEDLKAAMRAGERVRLETVRSLRAALLELEKSGNEVNDDAEQRAVMNQGKRRRDAIEQYRAAGRNDLADKEEAELKIIEEYLPQQLDDAAIEERVRAIIAETGAKGAGDFKVVMPRAVAAMRGVAEGGRIQPIVKRLLEENAG